MEMLNPIKNKVNLTEYYNHKSLAEVSRLIVDEMYNQNISDKEFANKYKISSRDMRDIQSFDYNPSLLELIELFDKMGLRLEVTTKPKEENPESINSISVSDYLRVRGNIF